MKDIDLASLTQSKGFKISGAAAGENAGFSVSNSGDINSDGINDIIIGAPYASPSGRNYAGAVYVIYGLKNAPVPVTITPYIYAYFSEDAITRGWGLFLTDG